MAYFWNILRTKRVLITIASLTVIAGAWNTWYYLYFYGSSGFSATWYIKPAVSIFMLVVFFCGYIPAKIDQRAQRRLAA